VGVFEFILGIVFVTTVGGIIKAAVSGKSRRVPGAERDALKRMEETLVQMRDEVSTLRQDVGELQERVDFTERVLTRGREDPRPPMSALDRP
jgi:uncharacterized protein YlxW (UPF0749 family)